LDANRPSFILIIAAGALALFLCRAGAMPLTDPDEGRYALIARQMATSGDWLVPRLFSLPYLEKPPLLYWLTATMFRMFGTGELSARLAPGLAAAFGVAVTGWFARSFSSTAGVLASATLALCAIYVALARTLVTDTTFTVMLTAALFSFFKHRETPGPSNRWALAFWISLALATLSKGPVAIVIGGLVIAIDAVLGRSLKSLFERRLIASSPIFLGIALPWFAMIQARYPTFLSFYLWKEHLERAAGSEHAEPFYWFVPWLLGGLMPWTPLAVVAAPFWWRLSHERSLEGRAARFLLVWAATVFAFFSAAGGKLATYILPMFPPLAVLLAMFLDRTLHGVISRAWLQRASAATGLSLILGAIALPASVLAFPAVGLDTRILIALPLLVGGAAILRACVASRDAGPIAAVVLTSALFYVVLGCVAPGLAASFTAKPLIDRVAAEIGPDDACAVWGKYLPSAAFYLPRPPWLVGTRRELRYGESLVGGSPNIAADLDELEQRTAGQRLYVLTDDRSKREQELRQALGDVELLATNYMGALWLRSPAPSLQTLTQGSSK
jgi:4-amino-4-deoxy-L-arabinose transferase-like glycosyltransferase